MKKWKKFNFVSINNVSVHMLLSAHWMKKLYTLARDTALLNIGLRAMASSCTPCTNADAPCIWSRMVAPRTTFVLIGPRRASSGQKVTPLLKRH
mgnify:CR=1 FL=1